MSSRASGCRCRESRDLAFPALPLVPCALCPAPLAFSETETETETVDSARIAALLVPFLGDAALTAAQLAQLAAYLDLLLRWNTRMNLTAVRDPDNIVTRHFGESLFAARRLYPPGC